MSLNISMMQKGGADLETFLQTLLNGILIGGVYAVVGIGLTIIYGVMNVVNFAQGDFMMLGMFVTLVLCKATGLDPYCFIGVIAVIFLLIGYLTEKALIHRTIGKGHEIQILLTLGIAVFLRSLTMVIWGPNYQSVTVPYRFKSLNVAGALISYPRLLAFLVAVVVMLILWYFLSRTELGRAMRASSQNRTAAALMGINTDLMYGLSFSIGIMFAAIGGLTLVSFYYVFPDAGVFFGLVAFVVVIIGGLGDVVGAIVGALLIGILEALTAQYVALDLSQLGIFVAFILVLLYRPQGIIRGRRSV
jgi:branched-chain amino acid transport system permease protein